jgi:hypothetical protein
MPRRILVSALPILLLLTAGCASTAPASGDDPPETASPAELEATMEPAAEPAPAPEPPPPAAEPATAEAVAAAGEVVCFYGPVRESGIAATGGAAGEATADLLLRRTLVPDAARIVEESVRFDRAGSGRARPYEVVLDVDGDAVALQESEGAYSGTGNLHGEPWRWSAWNVTYTLTSGIRVDAAYELRQGGDGELELHGEKTAYGPDGSVALTLVEELDRIPLAECEERLDAARQGRDDG